MGATRARRAARTPTRRVLAAAPRPSGRAPPVRRPHGPRGRGRPREPRGRGRRPAAGPRNGGALGRRGGGGALPTRPFDGALEPGGCTGQPTGAAQPGPPHHAQAARRGHGGLRPARLPRHPGQRRGRDRQDLARDLLPLLLQQGGPAAGARRRGGGRGGRAVQLARGDPRRRRGLGRRAGLGGPVLGAVGPLRPAAAGLDRPGGHRSRARRPGPPGGDRHVRGAGRPDRRQRTAGPPWTPTRPAWP